MTPIVLVLLDGLGDVPHAALDGATTNEAAATPNLDAFAAQASSGVVSPLGRGRAPSSEVAHWTYFTGSLDTFPGRAVLEATGHGVPVGDDVIGYVALRSHERGEDGTIRLATRPTRDEAELSQALLAALPSGPFGGVTFEVRPLPGPDAVVMLHGRVHPNVGDTDSFEEDLHPLLRCEPLIDDPAAVRTADAVAAWTVASHEVLRDHPDNVARVRAGLPAFDVATTKWWGRRRPTVSFVTTTGLHGAIVSPAPYQGGMAELLGMRWVRPPPRSPGRDGLEARLQLTRELLDEGADFVHCHDKTADEAGHTKDPARKIAALESLDAALGLLPRADEDVVVMVTGDHATPAGGRMLHAGAPVPFLLRGPRVASDQVVAFGERHQAMGALGHLDGRDILPIALDAADRARFLGANAGRASLGAIGAGRATAQRLPPPR